MQKRINSMRAGDEGFTLIELLIAIVLVGVLSAVVVIGVGSLTQKGADSACTATKDAATAAATAHYATGTAYPTDFTSMVTAGELDAGSLAVTATTIKNGTKWTLTIAGGGATAPTFTCS